MIKEYSTSEFKEKYTDKSVDKANLFHPGYEDFFCIRIEDISAYATVPVPPSKEKSHSIIYITNGTYTFKKGNKTYHINANEFIVVPAGEVFSIDTIANNLKGFTVHFSPTYFIDSVSVISVLNNFEFLLPFTNSHFISITDKALVLNIFERLNTLYIESVETNTALITTYILALLYELKKEYVDLKPHSSTAYEALCHQFKQALFQNLKRLHRTSEYATLLKITPNHLNKVLKATTHKSPKQWINETLILEAKYLLHQTNLNISEIAHELGFDDPSYFTRLFRKIENATPSDYKIMIEKS